MNDWGEEDGSLVGPCETELAWAAGFFDGEGNTRANPYGTNGYHYLSMALGQVAKEPFDRFVRVVVVGKTYRDRKNPRRKQLMNIWRADNGEAIRVFELLKPFLSQPKVEQFQQALAKCKEYPGWGVGSGNNYKRRLNGA